MPGAHLRAGTLDIGRLRPVYLRLACGPVCPPVCYFRRLRVLEPSWRQRPHGPLRGRKKRKEEIGGEGMTASLSLLRPSSPTFLNGWIRAVRQSASPWRSALSFHHFSSLHCVQCARLLQQRWKLELFESTTLRKEGVPSESLSSLLSCLVALLSLFTLFFSVLVNLL